MPDLRDHQSSHFWARHIADFGAFRICREIIFPPSPRIAPMLDADTERFADVFGYATDYLGNLDWVNYDRGMCVSASFDDKIVGAAWGTRILRSDGVLGCNLTCAVDAQYEGRGLATLLTSTACGLTLAVYRQIVFVNLQTESRNLPGRRLAKRLGLKRAPKYDRRSVAPLNGRLYVTYRAPAVEIYQRCMKILKEMQSA